MEFWNARKLSMGAINRHKQGSEPKILELILDYLWTHTNEHRAWFGHLRVQSFKQGNVASSMQNVT